MARSSIREELKRRLCEYLAVAETHPPEECPLDVRSVATALRSDGRVAWFDVEAVNDESIHNHAAFARRTEPVAAEGHQGQRL